MKLLGKGGILEDIKRNLRYSDWGGGLPFQWNDSQNILDIKPQNELRKLGFRLGIATLYFILAVIQLLKVFERASLMVITHSILMLAGWTLALSSQLSNYLELSGFVQLCNGFIQFERNFSKHFGSEKDSQSTGLFLRGLIYLLTFSERAGSIICYLDIVRNPCFPVYVGYWMNNQCEYDKPGYYLRSTWNLVEVLTKVSLSFATYLIWGPLCSGCLFQISLEYIMEGNSYRVFITDLGKKVLQIHKDETTDLKKLTLFHRQLQIIVIHYRSYLSHFQIGFAIFSLITIQTACLYNTISFLSGKDTGAPIWYDLVYAWFEVVIIFVIIFVFGILADVYNISVEVQKKINGGHKLKRNKWFRRWLKSCPIFKVYFGGSNYLDQLTPLNIQSFAINQTVSLMLLQK